MSEKFGLDWQKYDLQRIALLQTVHSEKIENERRERKKAEQKAKMNR